MKQEPARIELADIRATAESIARLAPESDTGWVIEPDGRTVHVAGITDEPEIVHATRAQVAETIAWGLFVEADERARKLSA